MKKIIRCLIVGTLVLTGCSSGSAAQPQATSKITADETKSAEIVIVGAGGGGMSAALKAVENGAESVLLLERTNTTGGSLNYTSGSMSGAETCIQKIDGVSDTTASYVDDIMANGANKGDKELLEVYAKEDINSIQWLWDNGLSDNKFSTDRATGTMSVFAPEHKLYSIKRTYKPSPDDSKTYKSAAHEVLDLMLKKNDKIQVEYGTEATQIAYNDKNQALKVYAKQGDKTIEYTASKGLIMATGGYSGNTAMMSKFKKNGAYFLPGGSESADGYGIYMMQEAGAYIDKDVMGYIPTFPMGLDTGSGPGKIASTYMWKTGGICVNKDGNRFVKETEAAVEIRETTLEQQPEAVQYDIFTDKIIADAQEKKTAGFWNYYYAPDAPYHRVVVSAPTIAELAAKLGVNADNLAKTVASYNQHVEAGTDDEFGRKFKDTDLDGVYNVAVNKIEGDMYYAVPLHALCVLTLGGVKINANAQVLDNDQKPIPGLYAAGECVGGIWGEFASSGTGVMGPITFGRIAAEHAMSSDPATGYQPTKSSGVIAQDVFVKEEKETSAITFDMSQKLKDGTYETGVEGQEGTLKVQVTIQANKITDVKILEAHESSFTEEAQKKVPAAIVAANSLDVDGVSGATLTSTRIKQAVKNCLEQALQK